MGMLKELIARISLDGSGFQAGAKQVESTTDGLSRKFNVGLKGAIAGAFAVGAVVEMKNEIIDYASKINDLAAQSGVGTEALQEMAYAAKLNGATIEDVAKFYEMLGVARQKALGGDQDTKDSFAALGVSGEDLASKRAEEITAQIAVKVKNGDIQALIGDLRAVGGKGADTLVSAFKDGIDERAQEARDSGMIISDEAIKQLDEVGDRSDMLGTQLKVALAPAILFAVDSISLMVDKLKEFGAFAGALLSNINPRQIIKESKSPAEMGRKVGAALQESYPAALEAMAKVEKENDTRRAAEMAKRKEEQFKVPDFNKTIDPNDLDLDPEKDDKKKEKGVELHADNLARIGGFVGGAESAMVTIQRDTLKASQETAKNTQAIVAHLNKVKMGQAKSLIDSA